MALSIEGNRAGRKYQETFRSFRPKGSGSKLFEPEGAGEYQYQGHQLRSPPSATSYLSPLKPGSSHSRASSRNNPDRLLKSRQKTPGASSSSRGSSRLGHGIGNEARERHLPPSREKTKSRSKSVKKEKKPLISSREGHGPPTGVGVSYEHRPASRSASRSASRMSDRSERSPATSPGDFEMPGTSFNRLEQSLESITLSDYMSNLLRKNHNKSRQSTPQSDLGDEDVRPQSVEHLEMQCDIEDNNNFSSREGSANGRLRSMLSRGQSRKGRPPTNPSSLTNQNNWLLSDNRSKEFEMDFRPATASDRIVTRGDTYSDPLLTMDTHVTTKEVDLSALSADFFSPTKKKNRKKPAGGAGPKRPPSQMSRKVRGDRSPDQLDIGGISGAGVGPNPAMGEEEPSPGEDKGGEGDDDAEERERGDDGGLGSIDYDYPVVGSRRKPQSARAMLEGWQKRMNEMERPPSRQRPPPESLHLYAEGFAARISNVKRPSTAVSPSRHNRQADKDSKLFAAYYNKKKDSQSLRENLRGQSPTIKYSSYEGESIRAPSRRGRKKRVKEAFATKE
ncbi:hypothetical protein HOP50_01g07260 [Chloropicon primus]|uniref:Uncharacterized protein n=1 Tax=Chloropicon primus TaxID=1764295 RepID=A0A5B8MDJ8_9CHLO|nr:hypothetical protein A3770_01p07420 [Chloropicon primus]UPQ97435.1 hypothetical protein HOP50_01g07260 [Chloropicon primus]|eukprot:QDZ18224.1 hypothetical protein A3770_01p07420 [Chloropicon primus]